MLLWILSKSLAKFANNRKNRFSLVVYVHNNIFKLAHYREPVWSDWIKCRGKGASTSNSIRKFILHWLTWTEHMKHFEDFGLLPVTCWSSGMRMLLNPLVQSSSLPVQKKRLVPIRTIVQRFVLLRDAQCSVRFIYRRNTMCIIFYQEHRELHGFDPVILLSRYRCIFRLFSPDSSATLKFCPLLLKYRRKILDTMNCSMIYFKKLQMSFI